MIKLLSNAPLDGQTKQGKIPHRRWTRTALVLDAIWCFKSHYPAVIATWRWRSGSASWGMKRQIRKGSSFARQGVAERQPRYFAFPGWVRRFWRGPSGAKLCNSAGRGGCAGRGQGNESGQANIKCLKLCCQCQTKEPREDEWKWSHFHLPVVSGRALCSSLNRTYLCLFA